MHAIIIDTTMTGAPTGGSHKFLVDLCSPLAKRGWSSSFVTQPGPERGIVDALRAAGAEVHERIWREKDLPEERARRLATWVNGRKIDVYVISTSPDAAWLALPLLDAAIPTVSIAHNDVGAYYEPLKHYGTFIDCTVSVSREIQRRTIEDCGIPRERTQRISYGVEILTVEQAHARANASMASDTPLKIGYVGRVVREQKRVNEMVPLASELTRRGVEFELHVIGDGEMRAPLASEFRKNGLEERVKFWGWLSPDNVRQRLRELDVFLLMSDYEGLSVALLEAMGQAVAPVVSDIRSGTSEVVEDGRSGFLVPIGDVTAFADRIEQLARNHRLLAEIKFGAWEATRPYTLERMADSYVNCFQTAHAISSLRVAGAPRQLAYPVMPSCRSKYPFWLRKIKRGVLVSAGRGRY
jgi:glycosyltransferase involved in cell wall biosynthesis